MDTSHTHRSQPSHNPQEYAHQPVDVRHNLQAVRYEIFVDGKEAGFASYVHRETADQLPYLDFNHTVIDPDFRGQGLSKPLIQFALDDVSAAGQLTKPTCSAVAKFIEKNPDYQRLVIRG